MKRVVILTGPGHEDPEFIVPWLVLPAEGIEVEVATSNNLVVIGKHGYPAKPTITLSDLVSKNYDAVLVAGGYEAPDRLRQKTEVIKFVQEMYKKGKIVAAICHGPWVLASSNILKGKKATCYPGMKDDLINAGAKYLQQAVVVDGNLVTSDRPESTGFWVKEIVNKLK
ncbi:hypothetical protein A3C98_00465 [Candidatus Roizmanbacteria bacterium RIFCSPHIGHO2_02_FULL_37_15]|uniref:DJ-1/PfpI domain-containing protein n=1 Tax=Candidatus Roizmanbacteria bacterium RIFCSPLOWO2_01_FULL_37_16 TaxID=1802058 RepID=A0A1F7IQU1_9BACT|nr:MAG: hypothetical protein A2859_02640 [Candidatus Roizmanbacteria bacterium RIFCSPHIGHO2_01_FULL_37_16b]OGK22216.1 MAG: hypothetical protein A3C98_00465 [Candidatus Roizmanbacteria bacterium RIFCSPHIGHO2_02_FULL_37_15]OGK33241.1 MAG: hypothetical protein A3F57_03050 [Candidatus Roizmanbacteria bacterium RIFCSPHIGHO2_12_FULL_36_11]OGK45731.1 MAG: hypothetical protein A3B40_05600 [Candidatus Roizmanbacteria bacterium RIFCSPLOWO2_01_FULL_37_16]OGK56388.1 MAG: hypothetical protein A3I50_00860 [C